MGYYVIDGGGGNLASVSIFEDRAGIEESDRRAAQWAGENLADLKLSGPEITEGEVVVAHPAPED
jgi:hypothetical protein